MSKVGRKPITIPKGVDVKIENNNIIAKGPLGENSLSLNDFVTIKKSDSQLTLNIDKETNYSKSIYGLERSLLSNLIKGVSDGFIKKLQVKGVGYRASVDNNKLILNLGFSHPVEFTPQEGINLKVEKNIIIVSGVDRQKVGQVAAKIRSFRPPEPYKGKGIRYLDEEVKLKPGKAAKAATGVGTK